MKKALTILGLFILIAIGLLLAKSGGHPSVTPPAIDTNETTPPGQDLSQTPSPMPQVGTVTVSMTDNGFQPNKITIPKDTVVTFVNNGKNNHWPASNIHPTHLIYPEFDPKRNIAPGESWSFTFDKVGIWKMHDHTYPNFTGSITVE